MAFYRLRSGAPAPGPMYKKRRTGPASTQQQLSQLKRKVAALKPETKVAYVTGQNANVAATVGNIQYLSTIGQGVTKRERLGDQIRLTRIQFRIQAVDVLESAVGNFTNRILLVRDKAATGVIPTIAGAASSILTGATPLGQPLPNTMDRFVILKDFVYNGSQIIQGTLPGQFYCDMKMNVVMDYLDTGSAIGSAGSNALFVVVLTDATAATQDWNFTCNLSFTDV